MGFSLLHHFREEFAVISDHVQHLESKPELSSLKEISAELASYNVFLETKFSTARSEKAWLADFAGQTNLFALNLAIECARLGEAGREPALVAERLRVLSNSLRATLPSYSVPTASAWQDFLQKFKKLFLSLVQ